VQRSTRIDPGQYWSRRLADVSDPGGSIEYVIRADRAFDVYFFTGDEDYGAYRAAIRGEYWGRTPTGHDRLSTTAVPTDERGQYAAATEDGARQSLGAEGPYRIVVDHTDYDVGPKPADHGRPLSATVDLTLGRNRF